MRENLSLGEQRIVLFSVFVLSLCGIIYELVLGSLATYLLGNPVQQYSITIGFFLSSMGLGSYLSRFIMKDILKNFIRIEAALGLTGGISVLVLSWLFSFSASFYFLHVFFLVMIGMLVGLEIPLITRVLKKYGALKDILSNVLSLDYIGGLAGSLLFPLVLFPIIGRLLTSIVVGMLNIAVAMFLIFKIDYQGRRISDAAMPAVSILFLLGIAFFFDPITNILQKKLYYDDIVYSKRSKYQEIVLTRNSDDFRLYLDGALQFSSVDEYRYHEMLVFPALALARRGSRDVLILGGGDGLAARETLKDPSVERITLVELDREIIRLARNNPSLKKINNDSLGDKKVEVVIGDAYEYLMKRKRKYDVIIADFPDPHDETISKLYTVEFFGLVKNSLNIDGVFVTQSTSPLSAREAFWCIHHTMKRIFSEVVPYHVHVPSFGDWGFNIGMFGVFNPENIAGVQGLNFFSRETFSGALIFSADIKKIDTKINSYNKPVLYNYYVKGWKYSTE